MACETFIDILNQTALNIYSEKFNDLNDNSKEFIKNTVNTVYKSICNRHTDWLFLNKVMSIPAWKANYDASHDLLSGTISGSKYNLPAIVANNAVYVAQKYTNSNDYPLQINNVTLNIGFQGLPPGLSKGLVMICPDLNGNPDIDNPFGESDIIDLLYATNPGTTLLSGGVNDKFLFNTPCAVPKNCTYWVVFKDKCVNGGASLTLNGISEVIDSKTLNPAVSNSWITNTGIGIYFIINVYNAVYSNILTAGPGIADIFGFYDNGNRAKRINTLDSTPSQPTGQRMNDNSYEINRINPDGTWTITFKSLTLTPLSWLMEYKVVVNDLVDDTNIPLVPNKEMIVKGSILELRSAGRGLNAPDNLKLTEEGYNLDMRNLEFGYRPETNIQPDINSSGMTPAGLVFIPGHGEKRRGRMNGRLMP